MAAIQITMLGGFQICMDGKPVLAPLNQSRKATSLVEYLLLRNGERVPHKDLTDALWGSDASTNPDMALRAILHRFRNMVEAEELEELKGCIITSRGFYQWNGALDCSIDVNEMELLSQQLQSESDPDRRETLCDSIIQLYKGRLLPANAGEAWVERRSVQLHARYQAALYELLDICKKRGDTARSDRLYARALELDPYDERLYLGRMLVLQEQGRHEEANELSRQGADRGCLSEMSRQRATHSLYRQLEKADRHTRSDIETVAAELERDVHAEGAFLCSYEVLSGLYQVQRRAEARYGLTSFLALVTLIPPKRKTPQDMEDAMRTLRQVLCRTLRSSDVVAEYSPTQYLVLLLGSDEKGASKPMERIKTNFYAADKPRGFLINCQLHAPEVLRTSSANRRR